MGGVLQLQSTGNRLPHSRASIGTVLSGPGLGLEPSGPGAAISQRRLRRGLLDPSSPYRPWASPLLLFPVSFLDGYGISPLPSQEGGEGDCGLCHSCHLKARASKGQKPRFSFLPALRRQDCGKEGKRRSPQHPFCWQLEAT